MSGVGAVVLVDLDDTLVAFDAVTEASWSEVCTEYHQRGCPTSPDTLRAAIREHSDRYWSDPDRARAGRADPRAARRRIVTRAFRALGLPEADAVVVADRYSTVRLASMYVFEGVLETLDRLLSQGNRLALITNGDSAGQREKIGRFALARYFAAILIEGELGFGKPDLRVYETALGTLRASAAEAYMVGDDLRNDVEAPQSVGIRAIWVDGSGAGLPSGSAVRPWAIVRRFAEIPAVMERASGPRGQRGEAF